MSNSNLWVRTRLRDWLAGCVVDLSYEERSYVHDVIDMISGMRNHPVGPCPPACRPVLAAMVAESLVPMAVPVLMELELSCAAEDQDP